MKHYNIITYTQVHSFPQFNLEISSELNYWNEFMKKLCMIYVYYGDENIDTFVGMGMCVWSMYAIGQ